MSQPVCTYCVLVCAGLDLSSGVCWPGESYCLGMLFVRQIDWQIFQLPPTSPIRYKKGYTCGKDIDFDLAMVVWQEIIDYNSASGWAVDSTRL